MAWRLRGGSSFSSLAARRQSQLLRGSPGGATHPAASSRGVCSKSQWQPPQGVKIGISLKNSLTGNKDPLVVPAGEPLTWYSCGPTVYDAAHLGHARNYVCLDILHRVLTDHYGVPVLQVINITDIDDKIILRAAEQGVSVSSLSRHWEREFQRDLALLGVRPPAAWLRVSDHMDAIIAFIQRLVDGGSAYSAADGSGVYFDVESLPRYGVLRKLGQEGEDDVEEEQQLETQPAKYTDTPTEASNDPSQMQMLPTNDNSRDSAKGKRNKRDFALWKNAVVDKGNGDNGQPVRDRDVCWKSPWGFGRPGWHIECSAIAETVFGDELLMHTGGIDLAFPHHENEIAQCEAAINLDTAAEWQTARDNRAGNSVRAKTWHRWCHYFVHTGHLHIAGRKMSKSLKNFISIRDFLKSDPSDLAETRDMERRHRDEQEHHRGTSGTFRMFCLLHKYNSNVVYSPSRIDDASKVLKRVRGYFNRAHRLLHAQTATAAQCVSLVTPSAGLAARVSEGAQGENWGESSKALVQSVWSARKGVEAALSDDLDTPTAMAVLLQHLSYTNGLLDKHEEELAAAAAAARSGGTGMPPLGGLWVSVRYVASICRLFGLDDADTGAFDRLLLPISSASAHEGTSAGAFTGTSSGVGSSGNADGLSAAGFESAIDEILRLRSVVRSAAIEKRALNVNELWSLCDQFRDELLAAKFGVSLKDHRDGTTSWERTRD